MTGKEVAYNKWFNALNDLVDAQAGSVSRLSAQVNRAFATRQLQLTRIGTGQQSRGTLQERLADAGVTNTHTPEDTCT